MVFFGPISPIYPDYFSPFIELKNISQLKINRPFVKSQTQKAPTDRVPFLAMCLKGSSSLVLQSNKYSTLSND